MLDEIDFLVPWLHFRLLHIALRILLYLRVLPYLKILIIFSLICNLFVVVILLQMFWKNFGQERVYLEKYLRHPGKRFTQTKESMIIVKEEANLSVKHKIRWIRHEPFSWKFRYEISDWLQINVYKCTVTLSYI